MFNLKNPPPKSPPDTTLRLSSTRGQPAPPDLAQDAVSILALPEPVKERFFEVLAPYLGGEPDAQQAEALGALCEEHALEPARLVDV